MRVLVVNAGSSTLKLTLLGADDRVEVSDVLGSGDWDGVRAAIAKMPRPDAVGHRVVHGGGRSDPVVVDDRVRRELEGVAELAPLHQPTALAGIDAVGEVLPEVPSVACFDTAFHASLPPAAYTYAVPREWRELGVRRYGFHGLSYAYASRRAVEILAGRAASRLVICHLGAGASICAVRDGASVDTTMGFTPLEGLVMATRAGTVDPGILLWLANHKGYPPSTLERQAEHDSGLLALAGRPDMREVAASEDAESRLAFDVYVHRLRREIAAMTASLGGLDALIFTGGVGENQPGVRSAAVDGLSHLGVALDAERNEAVAGDGEIGTDRATVPVLVVRSREDLEIARQARSASRDRGRGAAEGP